MKSEGNMPPSKPGTSRDTGDGGEARSRSGREGIRTTVDCVPCFVRQALDSLRLSGQDPALHGRFMREALLTIADADMEACPPLIARQVHRRLRELTGVEDPYREAKDRFNRLALKMLPELSARVAAAPNPFELSTRLAIAGNVIDLGAKSDLGEDEALSAVAGCLDEPFHGDIEAFRNAAGRARRILYLADNAGEIVFDRLLIERLGPERVTVAVRGSAVINDATVHDARTAGLEDLVEVIDNGADLPGTVLSECSPSFLGKFHDADLVIAKGQGNFETLAGQEGPIFYLFKVKCRVISSHIGLPIGTHVLEPASAKRR